jgi:hypothetical protein
MYLYRGMIERTIRGKRSQAFLHEMAAAMDAMPEKRLIADELISKTGEVCAIGTVCKARGLDVNGVDLEDRESVGRLVGISGSLAAEIEYENDEGSHSRSETPEKRWTRVRSWVASCLLPAPAGAK